MSSTALKLLALLLMFCDHVYDFIPNAPEWLTWLGRFSAPLFVFVVTWSLYYTHDRKKYLLNMYCWGIGMGILDILVNLLVKNPVHMVMENDIFVTMFLIGIIVTIIEWFMKKEWKKAWIATGLLILAQVISTPLGGLLVMTAAVHKGPWILQLQGLNTLVCAVFPSLLLNEGGAITVAFGVAIYFCRKNKIALSVCFIAWMLVGYVVGGMGAFTLENLFVDNYEWMVIFALPFALSYNHQKGKGYKYFFYIFYPAHIALLFLIGNML